MLHATVFFRVPRIGLFGSTISAQWGFRFGPHPHVCGHGGISTNGVDEVCEALESMVTRVGAQKEIRSLAVPDGEEPFFVETYRSFL
jgi:hypothetical protein